MVEKNTYRARPNRFIAFAVPGGLVLLMWLIHFLGWEYGWNLSRFGLRPRAVESLPGIFTMPFIHGSWKHLFNNSVPLLVLGWALFTFYRSLAFKTLFWVLLISGVWLWISGRPSTHIGASGVVYGLATFLFFSGWFRREKKVAALSLLVAFLYGGLWWGVLPVDPTISWEGHLWGALAGLALAVVYRKQGPRKPEYEWEHDEELERIALGKTAPRPSATEAEKSQPPSNAGSRPIIRPRRIVYHYKTVPKSPQPDEPDGKTRKDDGAENTER